MQRILGPVLGLFGLAILCLFCVRCHAPRIQAELTDQGRQRLTTAGLDSTDLEVDGRDATLTGWVTSEDDLGTAERVVGEVPGMRVVDNRLDLLRTASFELDRSADAIVLRGLLPSEAHRDSIVTRVREQWGPEVIAGELSVGPTADEPAWLNSLPAALAAFGRRAEGGSLAIDGGELKVRGRMFADSTRRALLDQLGAALPGLRIADEFEIRPPENAAELQATLNTAVLSRTVEFASNSAELTNLGRSVLDEISELLSSQQQRIAISGHTDDQGDDTYNLDLSRQRAEAARDYLVEKGFVASRFETAGFGESQPIADNTTPEGRLKNRRIEFAVQEETP